MPAWKSGDRVKETTSVAGVGDATLAGAVTEFQAFSAIAADQDRVAYAIVGPTEWEVGIGTWTTGNILKRTTVLASSNGGALVIFSAGVKEVFSEITAMAHQLSISSQEQGMHMLIPNRSSSHVSDEYEILTGYELEIGVNAILEVK